MMTMKQEKRTYAKPAMKNRIMTLASWLVMAAALAMGTTGCSGSDEAIEPVTQESPATPKTYTLTVTASKDGDDVLTRALGYDENTKTLSAEWAESEKVLVFKGETLLGTLSATDISSDKTTCTLTGTLDADRVEQAGGLDNGEELTLRYHAPGANVDNVPQDGTLETLASYYDYAEATITANVTTDGQGNAAISTASTVNFVNQQAIVRFSLKEAATDNLFSATSLVISDNNDANHYVAINTKNSETLSTFFVALSDFSSDDITVTAYGADGYVYTYTRPSVTFAHSQFYSITMKMAKGNEMRNLSTVTASSLIAEYGSATLTLNNGDVVTGKLDGSTEDGKVKIVVEDNAKVTLYNATIDGKATSGHSTPWAGITCEGDANIILSGANTVTNFDSWYPAIFVPSGKTLTIGGMGSLTASNTYNEGTGTGAAIGGGDGMACGNITITGGSITANGGSAAIGGGPGANCGSITISGGNVTVTAADGAGIGSGYAASCGDITISGACTVTATAADGAGIGSGYAASCGDITISGACTVTATGGENGAGIGTGLSATCGDITITGGTVTATGGNWAAGIGCGKGENGGKSVCGAITIKTIESQEDDFPNVTAIRGWGYLIRPIGHSYNDRNSNTCGIIMFGYNTVYDGGNDIESYNTTRFEGLNFLETTTVPTGKNNDDHGYDSNTWVLTK